MKGQRHSHGLPLTRIQRDVKRRGCLAALIGHRIAVDREGPGDAVLSVVRKSEHVSLPLRWPRLSPAGLCQSPHDIHILERRSKGEGDRKLNWLETKVLESQLVQQSGGVRSE